MRTNLQDSLAYMEATLDALRALRLAEPGLGVKPLVSKLKEQQPGLEIGAKEVREMCRKLDEEQAAAKPDAAGSSAAAAAAGAPADVCPPADSGLRCTKCQAPMQVVVASCSVCEKLVSDGLTYEEAPTYCSEKCKRKDMPAHRRWHRDYAIALEHKKALLVEQSNETRLEMLGDVRDDYDLENVAAVELMNSGNSREAIRRLRRLTKDRPYEPEAHFNLGGVYIQMGDRANALEAFENAFEWHDEGCLGWAQSAIMVHQCIIGLRKKKEKKGAPPAWSEPEWHKDALSALMVADLVILVSSDDDGGWGIKADALLRLGRKKEAQEAERTRRELHEKAEAWGPLSPHSPW